MARFRANWSLAATRGLALLLAGVLLLIGLLATDGQFHQSFHPNGKTTGTGCLLCLFAKGLVELSDSVPFQPVSVNAPVDLVVRIKTVTLSDFSYLAFPSRAPPASGLASSVVA